MANSREESILRERQAASLEAFDRLSYALPGAGPMLVQVFQQVSIPTTAGKYFACHPVDPGGAECEGCAGTFAADSGVVYVLVTGAQTPGVGDYLKAHPIGGRWVADGKRGSCLWTFLVSDNCTSAPIPGANVSISLSGTEIATCTVTGQVVSVNRVATGTNYTSVPTVSITGVGSGATAVADMQLGSLVRTSGGSGYNNGTFTGTFTGGGPGTGATFTFTVTGGVVQSTFVILTQGSGYTSIPSPDFSAAGPGAGAAATVRLNVRALVLTASGSGYTAATVGITGGGGAGATGTATVATRCTLSVPAGTYDVTITPPAGTGYGTYAGPIVHNCNQTTAISLSTDPSHICNAGCTQCAVMPSSVFITFTYGGSYTGFLWPNSTLTWDPARSGYASGVFDGPGGPTDPRQIFLTCQPSFSVYELRWATVPAGGGGGPFAHANFGPAITCTPFFIPNGVFDVNTSPAYGSWIAT